MRRALKAGRLPPSTPGSPRNRSIIPVTGKRRYEPELFAPLRNARLIDGDHHMHLADLKSYFAADQRLCELYADGDGSARKAILNVAGSGKFTSEYASEIWNAKPCPVA